ncbi:MAG: hypothetical protein ABI382_04275 [Nakamurella sp.]
MFGLSWDQIILILLAALFLLGPERIPTAIKWLMDSLRKARTFAAGAQSEMRSQLGPELDELRRQIAELQSLKEVKELKDLRDLDPRRLIGKNLLGEEFSGGIKGFLGLTGNGIDFSVPKGGSAAAPAPITDPVVAAAPSSVGLPDSISTAAEQVSLPTPTDSVADIIPEPAEVSSGEASSATPTQWDDAT